MSMGDLSTFYSLPLCASVLTKRCKWKCCAPASKKCFGNSVGTLSYYLCPSLCHAPWLDPRHKTHNENSAAARQKSGGQFNVELTFEPKLPNCISSMWEKNKLVFKKNHHFMFLLHESNLFLVSTLPYGCVLFLPFSLL
jgi:hypothetical protein